MIIVAWPGFVFSGFLGFYRLYGGFWMVLCFSSGFAILAAQEATGSNWIWAFLISLAGKHAQQKKSRTQLLGNAVSISGSFK